MSRSLRVRLTLVYGGLFLLGGLVLLAVTYLLFDQQLRQLSPPKFLSRGGGLPPDVNGVDVMRWLGEQREELRVAATRSLLVQGTVALAAVGALAGGTGWLVVVRFLAPLRRVTETARRIATAHDIAVGRDGAARGADRLPHERIALRGPDDEVKELADSFDTMVDRLDRAFDGQRRFVANASHELRTPLTVERAVIELAMRRAPDSPELRRLGEDLLRLNERHERLISGLLMLARSEQYSEQGTARRSPVDLADIVEHVVEQTAAEADRAAVDVQLVAEPAPAVGDPLLLERMVHNLVENAIRHNVRDGSAGWVRVTSRAGAEVEVANTGPIVSAYEVPVLFEPFRRLGDGDPLAEPGAGLGLSIVRSLALAHDAEVDVRPRDGGGLVVTLRFGTGARR